MVDDKKQKEDRFVEYVLQNLSRDTGFRAALTRADNPQTEPQAWPYLANYCDLEKPWERLPYALVAACMARLRAEKNGTQSLGEALRFSKENLLEDDDSIERKLRRILACDNVEELVSVLRPILRYVTGKENVSLNYAQLLRDVLYFNEKTKTIWAKQYYSKKKEVEECSSPE